MIIIIISLTTKTHFIKYISFRSILCNSKVLKIKFSSIAICLIFAELLNKSLLQLGIL